MNYIYEFRPLPKYTNIIRYNNGNWIPDDGEYDVYFVCKHDGFPFALSFYYPYKENVLWKWCHDNQWHAKVPRHPGCNAWHIMLKPGKTDKGNNLYNNYSRVAIDKCSSLYSCANGRGPEMDVHNSWISQGLVRHIETKETLVPPDVFVCMYCGPILWREKEKVWTQKVLF